MQKKIFLKTEGDNYFDRNKIDIKKFSFKSDLIFKQVKKVSKKFKKKINILEIGCGQPARLFYFKKKIIKNIRKSFKGLTIIFVSHRMNVIKHADKILFFEKGKVKFEGNYSKLKNKSQVFRSLIEANNSSNSMKSLML